MKNLDVSRAIVKRLTRCPCCRAFVRNPNDYVRDLPALDTRYWSFFCGAEAWVDPDGEVGVSACPTAMRDALDDIIIECEDAVEDDGGAA